MKKSHRHLAFSLSALLTGGAFAQLTGPSTASTPYVLPTRAGFETISLLTVDNTGAAADDTVPNLVGGAPYGLSGIPDGQGAFDNGDGTFTLLVNHELANNAGAVRAHGARGSFVSKWVVSKNTLEVLGGEDLMKEIYGWNVALQQSNPAPAPLAFNRYCSADLAEVTAFYNAATGLGTQARIFLNGEEGGSTGWARGHVASGPDVGKSYVLGKFTLSSNGSGQTGVGAWENVVASPFPQDKTIVIGLNDGGTGIMNNALSVYVGTKQAAGTEVEKAGLMNGTLKHIQVAGIADEISNGTTRTTGITNGTRFTLSANTSTFFSRPEDGAWNPNNRNEFYFVTTDRQDQAADGVGAQIGQTRLWRLTFDDITNPDLGGKIDVLIDGRVVDGEKVNMFDNLAVNAKTGRLLLQEDVGGGAHNGKIWEYDPATNALVKIVKHDATRFGDRAGGVTTAATAPFTNDEEASGIIDITAIMSGSILHKGNPREAWYSSSDQAHYTSNITTAQVEGGQLFILHDLAPDGNLAVAAGGFLRDRRTGYYTQQVRLTNNNAAPLSGPFYLVVDALSANATVVGSSGLTSAYAPLNRPYVLVPGGTVAPGATLTVTLQFANPSNGAITYTARVLNSVAAP